MVSRGGPANASPTIRDAQPEDIHEISRIYAHHVLHGLASFEEQPPDVTEMHRRMEALHDGGYPYVVAEIAGTIVGFSYAGPYRTRPSYRYSVECSVYLDGDMTGRGIGKALLKATIQRCETLGFRQMVAVIGDSENTASIGLHKSGFFPTMVRCATCQLW